MKKLMTGIYTALLVLTLSACGNTGDGGGEDETLQIYTTVFPLKSFAEQIGGDTVDVETIYPNGVDVHSYEPTQKEMIDFAGGDLFLYTTDKIDPVAEKIKNAVGDHSNFYAAGAVISEEDFIAMYEGHDHGGEGHDHGEEEHEHGTEDPHIWLDPMFSLRSEEHTSELQSRFDLVCRLLLEQKN